MSDVERQSRDYYTKALADGSHTAYLAYDGDKFVGAGGVSYFRVMPTYHNPSGEKTDRINELRKEWEAEEKIAHIHGWDFSHIHDRYEEEDDLPWDYKKIIEEYLDPDMKLMDFDTGGGEFLLSLGHPYKNTAATEGFPPNVELCKETLLPLGLDFKPCDNESDIPFKMNH